MRPANPRLRAEVLRIVELKLQDGAKRARLKYADIAAACNVQPDTLARAVCVEMKRRRETTQFPSGPLEPEWAEGANLTDQEAERLFRGGM